MTVNCIISLFNAIQGNNKAGVIKKHWAFLLFYTGTVSLRIKLIFFLKKVNVFTCSMKASMQAL